MNRKSAVTAAIPAAGLLAVSALLGGCQRPSHQADEMGGDSGPNGPVGLAASHHRMFLRGGLSRSSFTKRYSLPRLRKNVASITLKPGS